MSIEALQTFEFEYPRVFAWGLGSCVFSLLLIHWAQTRSGVTSSRSRFLECLRFVAVLALVFLAAQPGCREERPKARKSADPRRVVVMVDDSESMAGYGEGEPPVSAALAALKRVVLPALAERKVPVSFATFSESYQELDAVPKAVAANGKRTDLAGAIERAIDMGAAPPLAVIALTDGILTQNDRENNALSRMVAERIPLIGIGFGRDVPLSAVSLEEVLAPESVVPGRSFDVALRVEATAGVEIRPLDVVLLRDGVEIARRTVKGSESFALRCPEMPKGVYRYVVRLEKDDAAPERVLNSPRDFRVEVKESSKIDVLFVQGSLGWDYKFLQIGVGQDSLIRMSGITRTRDGHYFRFAADKDAFMPLQLPSTVEGYETCKLVILSAAVSEMMNSHQANALAELVSKRGAGLIFLGLGKSAGVIAANSALSSLLPVQVAKSASRTTDVAGFDLTATGQGVFLRAPGLGNDSRPSAAETVRSMVVPLERNVREPTGLFLTDVLTQLDLKMGAQVLARSVPYPQREPGNYPFIVTHRVGNGRVALVNGENLWRLRMGSESHRMEYDRFWRKFIRYMASEDSQTVRILFPDGIPEAPGELNVSLELLDPALLAKGVPIEVRMSVEEEGAVTPPPYVARLAGATPAGVKHRLTKPGRFLMRVRGASGEELGWKDFVVTESNVEKRMTVRDMETLGRWAATTRGVALRGESLRSVGEFGMVFDARMKDSVPPDPGRRPLDHNWVFVILSAGCLSLEWLLRKRWKLT